MSSSVQECDTFTAEMRRATRGVHSLSDSLVNAKLVLALSDELVWADALLVFYEVFKFLEQTKEEMKDFTELQDLFVDDVLLRTSSFESDLSRLLGAGWRSAPLRPEVCEYVSRLQQLREERPRLLLAYVYHLYLGLLSGGQIIASKRRLHTKVNPFTYSHPQQDAVVSFGDVNIKELKLQMKAAMNRIAAQWTVEQRLALINESQMVFTHNNLIVKSVRGTYRPLYKKAAVAILTVQLAALLYYMLM